MYVDKKLSGVTAVQTLSRLNRTAKGKDVTFVLDFVNEPNEILEAFLPYFRDAQLADIADPNIIHDIATKLDHSGIYDQSEVDVVVETSMLKKGNNKLSASLAQVKDRFWKKYQAAVDSNDKLEVDRLIDFRKSVDAYTKAYDFLSQLYNYGDTAVEKKAIFLRLLAREIRANSPRESIDLEGVELAKLGFKKHADVKIDLTGDSGVLKPISAVGGGSAHDPVMTTLREAVDQMNAIFDDPDLTFGDGEGIVAYVSAKAREDVNIQKQAKANTLEQFLDSPDLMTVMLGALFASQGNFTSMTKELAEDDEKLAKFVKAIGKVVHAQLINSEGNAP
jgi:type I restriction enzyme R subunit